MHDIVDIIADAEDFVFPQLQLDVWERALYYHLLRRTLVAGAAEVTIGIDPLADSCGISTTKLRDVLRALKDKNCIAYGRTREGHTLKVCMPRDIPSVSFALPESDGIDGEAEDVYSNDDYRLTILARENHRCFYCSKHLDGESVVLDHVTRIANGGSNSYRNIVAACHECNSLKDSDSFKDGDAAENFFRVLYRCGRISAQELEEGQSRLVALRAGELRVSKD